MFVECLGRSHENLHRAGQRRGKNPAAERGGLNRWSAALPRQALPCDQAGDFKTPEHSGEGRTRKPEALGKPCLGIPGRLRTSRHEMCQDKKTRFGKAAGTELASESWPHRLARIEQVQQCAAPQFVPRRSISGESQESLPER